MFSFFKSVYAQFLYWLALRFQVTRMQANTFTTKLVNVDDYTTFEVARNGVYVYLMNKSNAILTNVRERARRLEISDNSTRRLLLALSHNPGRKDPQDPVR